MGLSVEYGDSTTYIVICAFYSLFHGLFHSHMILYDHLYILHFICIFLHMLLIIYLHIFVVAVPVALSVYSCLHSHISPQFRVFSLLSLTLNYRSVLPCQCIRLMFNTE
jgi:hypothetical protein